MHVKVVVEAGTGREREVFAQLGKGGDLASSDLEAICRLVSLYLRVGGSLRDVIGQLDGIGSSLSVPSQGGRIMSLADGLAKALEKYSDTKSKYGLEALLLGKADLTEGQPESGLSLPASTEAQMHAYADFKIKCPVPGCGGALEFQETCAKYRTCGHSSC